MRRYRPENVPRRYRRRLRSAGCDRRPKLCRCRSRPSFIAPSLLPGRFAVAPRRSLGAAGERLLRLALIGDAAFKAFGDHFAGQVATDENDPAVALLISFPRPLMVAVEDHVHALQDKIGRASCRE